MSRGLHTYVIPHVTLSPTLGLRLTAKAIDVLFGFEPFFDLSVRKAREKIVKRSSLVGVNWAESIDNMRRNMDELENEYDRLLDRKVYGLLLC